MIGSPVGATLHVEHVHPGFTKHHLNQGGEQPWPFRPVLHHFTTPDIGFPHCHPYDFTSRVLEGSYEEEIYEPTTAGWRKTWRRRTASDAPHNVAAETIHRITKLPDGECWTLVTYGPTVRTSRFWQFGERILSRPWHTDEWSENHRADGDRVLT